MALEQNESCHVSRLDFDNLVLTNPNGGGLCNTDTLRITSAGASGTLIPPVPGTLCGINTGNFCKHVL